MKKRIAIFTLIFLTELSMAYCKEKKSEHLFDYKGKSYYAVSQKKFLSREKWALKVDEEVVTPFKYLSMEYLRGAGDEYFIIARTKGKKKLEYRPGSYSFIGASSGPRLDLEWDWFYNEFVVIGIDDYGESEPFENIIADCPYEIYSLDEGTLNLSPYYKEKLKDFFHPTDIRGKKTQGAKFLYVMEERWAGRLITPNAKDLLPDYKVKESWYGVGIPAYKRSDDENENRKKGLLLPDGEIILDFEYDRIREIYELSSRRYKYRNFIFAFKDGKEGVFLPKQSENDEGHFISPFKHEEIEDFLSWNGKYYGVVPYESGSSYKRKLVILNDDISKDDEVVLSEMSDIELNLFSKESEKFPGNLDFHWFTVSKNDKTALYRFVKGKEEPELVMDYVDGKSIERPFCWNGNYYCVIKSDETKVVLLGKTPAECKTVISKDGDPMIYFSENGNNDNFVIKMTGWSDGSFYIVTKSNKIPQLLSTKTEHDILYFRDKAPFFYVYDYNNHKYFRLNPDGGDEEISESEWEALPEKY